jgi:hypothetical protein
MSTDLNEAIQTEEQSVDEQVIEEQAVETEDQVQQEEQPTEEDGEPLDTTEAEPVKEAEPEKPLEERLLEQDALDSRSRQEINKDLDDIKTASDRIENSIKNPIPLNGKPAYLASDTEFEKAEDAILESGDPELLSALKVARQQRREYQKQIQSLVPQAQMLAKRQQEVALSNVEKIKSALAEINPTYKQYFTQIENGFGEEIKTNPLKGERFLRGGIQDQFRMIDRFLESSGIKQRVESEARANNRPNLAAPVSAGKGKRSNTPTGNAKVYTRAEIAKMSTAEYERQEKDIDKAMIEGRIK